jgi:UDP-N-acetylglucosamine 2-epimerase (non-hydrolysing)
LKLSFIFGTRPEVIKLSRVIKAFEEVRGIELNVCFSGQHSEMVMPLIDFFDLDIDYSLQLMQPNQTLASLSSRCILAMDEYLQKVTPDMVFIQGDTTTAFCAALASCYRKIRVAHVEAGLRTYNRFSPFPEEINRTTISLIADLHFAPTATASENLLREQVPRKSIFVTGNTVIDALFFTLGKIKSHPEYALQMNCNDRIILITGHRRENFGEGLEHICLAIKILALKYPDYEFIYPVHLNPIVQEPVKRILQNLPNVQLLPPMDYIQFTQLMQRCFLILTDSGGIQEEAPALGKPVLVMRDTTERPEAIVAGSAKLVGTSCESIVEQTSILIDDKIAYSKMTNVQNPFGDGTSAKQIVEHTMSYLSGL